VTDVDRASLDRILPSAIGSADWGDVLRRAGAHRARGRLVRVVLVAAAVIVIAGAASAFGTVRELFLSPRENSKIAFMHNTRKNCCADELWIMNADGSKPLRLARDASGARRGRLTSGKSRTGGRASPADARSMSCVRTGAVRAR
jgi:hypothetical protein